MVLLGFGFNFGRETGGDTASPPPARESWLLGNEDGSGIGAEPPSGKSGACGASSATPRKACFAVALFGAGLLACLISGLLLACSQAMANVNHVAAFLRFEGHDLPTQALRRKR